MRVQSSRKDGPGSCWNWMIRLFNYRKLQGNHLIQINYVLFVRLIRLVLIRIREQCCLRMHDELFIFYVQTLSFSIWLNHALVTRQDFYCLLLSSTFWYLYLRYILLNISLSDERRSMGLWRLIHIIKSQVFVTTRLLEHLENTFVLINIKLYYVICNYKQQ